MSAPPCRWLEVEEVGAVTVVRLLARRILTEEAVEAVGEELAGLLRAPGGAKVVLHLGEVESMTTLMVGRLVLLHRQVEAAGGRLVLCGAEPALKEVFALLRLPRVMPVYRGEQEALESFV